MMAFIRNFLTRVRLWLGQPVIERTHAENKRTLAQLRAGQDDLLAAVQKAHDKLVHDIDRQYHALAQQLDELTRAHAETRLIVKRLDSHNGSPRLGEALPAQVEKTDRAAAAPAGIPTDSILTLETCSVCGAPEATEVCEYNKLLLLKASVDEPATRYHYALCHTCGVVFARHRPVGPRFRYLVDRFEEALGRAHDGSGQASNAALKSSALSDDERDAIRAKVAKGVFVSEHQDIARRDWMPALLSDRLANSAHVEILGSLLEMERPRVLELRPRLGSIGAALHRLYGAEVFAIPLFEGQQFMIREAYGITADHLMDYDHFRVGYAGTFDLIIANHVLTHALRPRDLFRELRERLNPGGHLYLYNEADEGDFLATDKKSMISTLNPFHVQTFDSASFVRGLQANGFEPMFVSHHGGGIVALASRADTMAAIAPIGRADREARVAQYKRARDYAILKLPAHLRGRFAVEWDQVVERAVVAGQADFDERGRVRLRKPERER